MDKRLLLSVTVEYLRNKCGAPKKHRQCDGVCRKAAAAMSYCEVDGR